jgi:predicted ATPase
MKRVIPVTLNDSLMARLDRLGPAKDIAQLGAVIGNEFSYELIRAVHPIPEHDLQRALAILTDAELLYAYGAAPHATYLFKHALIRDAAYEALLKSQRKDLHRLVAQTISRQFPALEEEHPEVLAHHWMEAGKAESALADWQKAAERALERHAYPQAGCEVHTLRYPVMASSASRVHPGRCVRSRAKRSSGSLYAILESVMVDVRDRFSRRLGINENAFSQR